MLVFSFIAPREGAQDAHWIAANANSPGVVVRMHSRRVVPSLYDELLAMLSRMETKFKTRFKRAVSSAYCNPLGDLAIHLGGYGLRCDYQSRLEVTRFFWQCRSSGNMPHDFPA